MSTPYMGGCVMVGDAKVNMPPRLARRLVRYCPVDRRRTRFVMRYGGAWYGSSLHCCACGDSWSEGEMAERPFRRGWREEAKRSARAMWTEAVDPKTYDRLVMADVRAAISPS